MTGLAFQHRVAQALRDLEPYDYLLRALHPDGTTRVVHSRSQVVCNEAGKPVRMFGTAQDITERRRDEEAIEQSHRRFQAVFENSLDGILLMDDTGRYVDVNPSMCQLLGYSREEMLELTVRDITPAQDLRADGRPPGTVPIHRNAERRVHALVQGRDNSCG